MKKKKTDCMERYRELCREMDKLTLGLNGERCPYQTFNDFKKLVKKLVEIRDEVMPVAKGFHQLAEQVKSMFTYARGETSQRWPDRYSEIKAIEDPQSVPKSAREKYCKV